jgi:hypothetical protein
VFDPWAVSCCGSAHAGSLDGARTHLSQFRVGIQVISSHTHKSTLALTAFEPVRHDDWNVHLHCFLPCLSAWLGAYKVRGVDANGVDELCANTVDCLGQAVFELVGHHTRGDRDTGKVVHSVRFNCQTLGAVLTSRGAQHKVESVLGIQSQSRDLCAQLVFGNRACLVAVAIEAETTQFRCRKFDWIPLQYYAGLSRIAASEHGSRGRLGAKGVVNVGLQGRELLVGNCLGVLVAGDVDVDDASGVDIGWQEDRGEFDLKEWNN